MSTARDNAASIVRAIRGAGHAAYFAGGCVRDELLGLTPQDFDVATSATPDEVRRVGAASGWKVNEVGVAFGVLLVRTPTAENPEREIVEVATFREEGEYSDNRRPDAVRFSTASADARRRDYTVNALFLDPLPEKPTEAGAEISPAPTGGWIVDFVGGVADVRAKILRAVGDPAARLREDHLRALRGVRLASRLGFRMDVPTRDAIARDASALKGVSRERIGDEMRRMLGHPTRGSAAAALQDLGLDAPSLEEPNNKAALRTLGALPGDAAATTALAAWALDRDADGLASPAGVDALVGRWRRALCLSNDETAALRGALAGAHDLAAHWAGWGVAAKKRAAASEWYAPAWQILHARHPAASRAIEEGVAALAQTPGGIAPAALVTGDDLVAAGMTPGPAFKRLLERLYDLQLEGLLGTKDAALAKARELAR